MNVNYNSCVITAVADHVIGRFRWQASTTCLDNPAIVSSNLKLRVPYMFQTEVGFSHVHGRGGRL